MILPRWTVTAIAVVPGGAFPSYAHGYYKRANAFYIAWDAIARDRETLPRLDEGERAATKTPDDFAAPRAGARVDAHDRQPTPPPR